MDEDVRELARLAAAAPDDAVVAARAARALERAGDVAAAVAALVRTTDAGVLGEALVALDALTRGGIDPSSPWPRSRGDGRNSGRSVVGGPSRGAIVERRKLVDLNPGRDFCVDAAGEPVVKRPALLAGWVVRLSSPGSAQARASAGREVEHTTGERWLAALGLLVTTTGPRGLEARLLGDPAEVRARWPVPRGVSALAVAPGGHLLALSKTGVGGRGLFHRFDLASLRALPSVTIDPVGIQGDEGAIVVAPDGVAYLGVGAAIVAIDPEGRVVFRREGVLAPAALAGPEGEVLVACEPRTFKPVAFDREGRELWRSNDQCLIGLPKVDARGVLFFRREEELVAMDPRTGAIVQSALVGGRYWDFAFSGPGRVTCLRSESPGVTELVVVE